MFVRTLILMMLWLSAAIGCGDNRIPETSSVALTAIEVTPGSVSLAAGRSTQLTATARYSDDTSEDVTARVAWASSANDVATINVGGLPGSLRAARVGTAQVLATLDDVTGTAAITVSEAELVSIDVTPTNPSLARGTSVQLVATATYSDATTADVSSSATWASGNDAIATVSATGRATASAVGTTTVTATIGNVHGSTSLDVTTATLSTIEVTPTAPMIATGTTLQFVATGIFSDGTRQTMTETVTWTSSMAAATISSSAGTHGLARGVAPGATTITAIDTTTNVSGSTTLTITGVALVSIEVSPIDPSMPKGTSQRFIATGVYTDSSTQVLTESVTWTTTDAMVADVSTTVGSRGAVTAIATGMATITATDPATSIAGASVVTVTPAVLSSIQITPSQPSVANGTTLQFVAEGVFSDLTTQPLTDAVTWGSSTPGVAMISNAATSRGFAVTLAVGSTTITAIDPATNVTGSTTLTVTAAVLVRIDVDPANQTLPRGSGAEYTATGIYSDFTSQDLTASVTWSSSNLSAAVVSNADGSEGLTTTLAAGTTTITALDPATGISGTARLIVGTSVLLSMVIEPSDPTIAKGARLQFRCLGTYDDGTVRDITQFVTWGSSMPGTASISNAPKKHGLAQGKNPGTSTITATDPATGITASTTLTVTAATLSSISIAPVDATMPNRTRRYYTATGHYSDGSTADFTSTVAWSSSDPLVATISNQNFQWGTVAAVGVGTTTITAADPTTGLSTSTTLEVTDATLVSLAITPGSPNVIVSTQTQLTATGTFSDGSVIDVTRDVTWTSNATSIATVLNVGSTKGTVTGVAPGQASITANYPLTVTAAMITVTVIP